MRFSGAGCTDVSPVRSHFVFIETVSRLEAGEEVGDRGAEDGVSEEWSDFGEGLEDEAALVQGGVWKGEIGVGEDQAAAGFGAAPVAGIKEQVEIDQARAFRWAIGGAGTAHGGFDGEKRAQELKGAEVGCEQGGGVGEAGLVAKTYGIGLAKAGDGEDGAEVGEAVEGFADVVGGGAVEGRQIGAEGDGGEHGFRVAQRGFLWG